MGCRSRLSEVAKLVAAALDQAADPAAGITVQRTYAPDWLDPDYWKDNPNLQTEFTGRRVYVFGSAERQEGPATRGEDYNDYTITIIILERYDGSEPIPPDDWIEEREAWVESQVYDRLGDARAEGDDEVVPDAIAQSQEWAQVYSIDYLRQLKLFRSEVNITYRRIEGG